ncbi:SMP-30/gluconolactonase/LRE family protein [Neobacillus terrae]|uniref:SMP-30/gluconolactonase/LRE family protein n=1 Tax=Neobacillus terrae TaxID=3034837 RepID=UPI00140A6789|nr:SMP-30/gluconolactonase/LRE family protein [Neobacillus terrae]NHM33896.1 SMP-30/gluconolactonase/LRE family protein [Neobacillus terrae]
MEEKVELVFDAQAELGEGPSWDAKNQLLYWVDILSKKVCIFNPKTEENREIHLEQMASAVVPRESGGLVLGMENGFYFLDINTEELTQITDPESHLPLNRFNDGKCDPKGRFWAGSMNLEELEGEGSLYFLDKDLQTKKKVDGTTISNGLAWSPDNKFFYFTDTPTMKIVRYEYDLNSGEIKNPKPVIHFPESEGYPDGMTIDSEGMLWIAHWSGNKVSRWNPETGEQILSINIPAMNVTSCTFGGEDLSELYITTARKGMTEEELEKFPLSGGVFRVKTEIQGAPTYTFKG